MKELNGNGKRKAPNPTGIGGVKPGEVRNPNGRPPNTKFFSDYVKEFAGLTRTEIQEIAANPNELAGKVLAANEFINAMDGKGLSVDRVLNRSEGMPLNKSEVKSESKMLVEVEECNDADLITRTKTVLASLGSENGRTVLPLPSAQGGSN
jgi:hypothetical protein